MGAVRWRGSYVRGNKKGVAVDGSTHPQTTGTPQPNHRVQATGSSRSDVGAEAAPRA